MERYIQLVVLSVISAMVLGGAFLMTRNLSYGRYALYIGLVCAGLATLAGIIQTIVM